MPNIPKSAPLTSTPPAFLRLSSTRSFSGRWVLVILFIAGACLGSGLTAAELPDGAKRVVRAMEIEIARDRARAVKSLETEQTRAMKANDLDGALAIRTTIDELQRLIPKSEDEIGQAEILRRHAGRRVVSGHEGDYWLFRADGTFDSSHERNGKWDIKDDKVFIRSALGPVVSCTIISDELWTEDGKGLRWVLTK